MAHRGGNQHVERSSSPDHGLQGGCLNPTKAISRRLQGGFTGANGSAHLPSVSKKRPPTVVLRNLAKLRLLMQSRRGSYLDRWSDFRR
jgi:hypothetical protein